MRGDTVLRIFETLHTLLQIYIYDTFAPQPVYASLHQRCKNFVMDFLFKYASAEDASEHFQGSNKSRIYNSKTFSVENRTTKSYMLDFFPLSIMKSPDVSLIFSKKGDIQLFSRIWKLILKFPVFFPDAGQLA